MRRLLTLRADNGTTLGHAPWGATSALEKREGHVRKGKTPRLIPRVERLGPLLSRGGKVGTEQDERKTQGHAQSHRLVQEDHP